MSSGRRFRPARPTGRGAALLMALGIASSVALGGCATAPPSSERAAERQAALDRWSRCIERQSDVAALSEVRTRLARGCEGHRRDVLRAFPPRMEARLERLMDERTDVMLRTRAREERQAQTAADPVMRRVLDAFSDH